MLISRTRRANFILALGSLFMMSVLVISVLGVGVDKAYAGTTTDVNSTTCNGTTIPGTWDSMFGTCTLTGDYTVISGNTLEIPFNVSLQAQGSGTTVIINSGGIVQIDNGGLFVAD